MGFVAGLMLGGLFKNGGWVVGRRFYIVFVINILMMVKLHVCKCCSVLLLNLSRATAKA